MIAIVPAYYNGVTRIRDRPSINSSHKENVENCRQEFELRRVQFVVQYNFCGRLFQDLDTLALKLIRYLKGKFMYEQPATSAYSESRSYLSLFDEIGIAVFYRNISFNPLYVLTELLVR